MLIGTVLKREGPLSSLVNPFFNEKLPALVVVCVIAVTFFGYGWPPGVSFGIEVAVVVFFAVEALVRIANLGIRRYFQSNINRFDFFILCLSMILLAVPSFALESAVYLRALRLVGMLRAIRLVPNASQIINGLKRALLAARTVILFMFILMVVFSITGYSAFGSSLPEYFGTPLTSLNTVFSIFTIENWGAAPEAAKATEVVWLFYAVNTFSISVLVFGGFIALSLANAIFVDEMVSDNNDELMQKINAIEEKLDRLFHESKSLSE